VKKCSRKSVANESMRSAEKRTTDGSDDGKTQPVVTKKTINRRKKLIMNSMIRLDFDTVLYLLALHCNR
jgi:hypothetical protein